MKLSIGLSVLLATQTMGFAPIAPTAQQPRTFLNMAVEEGERVSKRKRIMKKLGKVAGTVAGLGLGAKPALASPAIAAAAASTAGAALPAAAGLGAAGAFVAGKALVSESSTTALRAKSGGVEWSVEKGSATFGLDLTGVPELTVTEEPFPQATKAFPGALSNSELVVMIEQVLEGAGYDKEKTLVATSLCCDEVNRPLETDLNAGYNYNFNMGGLAGFPFGGAVSFGAMAAHIPDGGSCAVVYGPHVGVDHDGSIGTVERRGRANGGACCGSAVAASGYVSGVFNGGAEAAIPDDAFDAQQAMVGASLLPYAERLEKADNKMKELPFALYEAQTGLMKKILNKSAAGVGDGTIAVLGGIQINTPPEYSDYFLPLSFEMYDNKGELIEDIMPKAIKKPFAKVNEIFPGALTNADLIAKVTKTLEDNGYDAGKTLVATSLCCDEVNRPLETDFSAEFDTNFHMGGLAGFPFGGATSFGAMASHIPDGGDTLVVFGPHVGVDSTGAAGTVERRGRANGGSCCGSAVAASGYVASVLKGEAEEASLPAIVDAQQYFVGKMLLPYAKQLEEAKDKMVELPYALYDAQKELMGRIVEKSAGAVADGNIAVLGGIQINTPEGYADYYMPLSFDLYNNKGKLIKGLWE